MRKKKQRVNANTAWDMSSANKIWKEVFADRIHLFFRGKSRPRGK